MTDNPKNDILRQYPDQYRPELLESMARSEIRAGLRSPDLSYMGFDLWHAYDFSWLGHNGCPRTAVVRMKAPCNTPRLLESKSFKLYLNSFAQTLISDKLQLQQVLTADLSRQLGAEVVVQLLSFEQLQSEGLADLPGICLDTPDINIDCYQVDSGLLKLIAGERADDVWLHSHLLRTLCPITGQPDWASIGIRYSGESICHLSLLRYIVSYRQRACFHEYAVEQIYQDILHCCKPEDLVVYARFQRRGGIDINPYRSLHEADFALARTPRQ